MELLMYLFKVMVCTIVFFTVYKLFLGRLTFFRLNRFYLLGSLVLSFIIPATSFTVEGVVEQVATETRLIDTQELQFIPQENRQQHISPAEYIPSEIIEEEAIDWPKIASAVYLLVAGVFVALSLFRLFTLLKHVNSTTQIKNGLKIIHKDKGFTNCSFFNYVFINDSQLSESELAVLIEHERVHAQQYHSVDKLLMMLAKAALWFNPIIYFYNSALEQTHEYEADEIASGNIGSANYADLLLRLSLSNNSIPLAHSFVKSPIKSRIKMLFNQKTNAMRKFVYISAIPVLLILIYGFTIQIVETSVLNNNLNTQLTSAKDDFPKLIKGKLIGFAASENLMLAPARIQTKDSIIQVDLVTVGKKDLHIGEDYSFYISDKRPRSMTKISKDGKKTVYVFGDVYRATKVLDKNDKVIYEYKEAYYPFLYEANIARFANTRVVAIGKNTSGIITLIKLNDGKSVIDLDITSLNKAQIDFTIGESVLAKFIGEQKVAANHYKTSQLISLLGSGERLINQKLYSKFYHPNGKQKVSNIKFQVPIVREVDTVDLSKEFRKLGYQDNKGSNVETPVILLSSKFAKMNTMTHLTEVDNAKFKIGDVILEAKQAVWNRGAKTRLAHDASTLKGGE